MRFSCLKRRIKWHLKSFEGTDRYRRKRKSDQICPRRIRGTKNRRSLMTDSKILRSEYSSKICNRFKCLSRMKINVVYGELSFFRCSLNLDRDHKGYPQTRPDAWTSDVVSSEISTSFTTEERNC